MVECAVNRSGFFWMMSGAVSPQYHKMTIHLLRACMKVKIIGLIIRNLTLLYMPKVLLWEVFHAYSSEDGLIATSLSL